MERELEKRFAELFRRAEAQGGYIFTNFLDLAGQDALQRSLPHLPPVPWTLFGGAEGCERRMLRLGDAESCGYDQPFPIACLRIAPASPKFAETLTHRDFLGALMNLGFERELLGDIVVREEAAYLFCVERIAPYIAESLRQVRRTAVRCAAMDALPEGEMYRLKPFPRGSAGAFCRRPRIRERPPVRGHRLCAPRGGHPLRSRPRPPALRGGGFAEQKGKDQRGGGAVRMKEALFA